MVRIDPCHGSDPGSIPGSFGFNRFYHQLACSPVPSYDRYDVDISGFRNRFRLFPGYGVREIFGHAAELFCVRDHFISILGQAGSRLSCEAEGVPLQCTTFSVKNMFRFVLSRKEKKRKQVSSTTPNFLNRYLALK